MMITFRDRRCVVICNIITTTFANREWAALPEEEPDDIDLQMLDDIKNNPDCKEFLPSDEGMKMLGL